MPVGPKEVHVVLIVGAEAMPVADHEVGSGTDAGAVAACRRRGQAVDRAQQVGILQEDDARTGEVVVVLDTEPWRDRAPFGRDRVLARRPSTAV